MKPAVSRLLVGLMPLGLLLFLGMTLPLPVPKEPQGGGQPAGLQSKFLNSTSCASCHANAPLATAMRDAKSRGLGPFDLWRSSMMANASRDPFWRAVVSAEIKATPSRKADIEAKCMRCHAPMESNDFHGDTDARMSLKMLDDSSDPRNPLARDGASCTVCHQILPDNLGKPSSYTGNFHIGPSKKIFGPHSNPFTQQMLMRTGMTPVKGDHIKKSGLCATCHTVMTHTLDKNGKDTGSTLPEQTPYLEWRNSIFNNEVQNPGPSAQSCQGCHLPIKDVDGNNISTKIARNPGGRDYPFLSKRAPFGRHILVGGNTLLPEIFRDNAQALGVIAPASAFNATIAAAKDQLQKRSAKISLQGLSRSGNDIKFRVRVENLAGHKFPSAYPSRRAWLRVQVLDKFNKTVFLSGDFDGVGRILGASGNPLAEEKAGGPYFVHRDSITASGQVQVWEAQMGDDQNQLTFTLLRAAKYLKDNRILPKGWVSTHPDAPMTKPVGVVGDGNFVGGKDEVSFTVPAPSSAGPYKIEVSLLYQTLSHRFADELFQIQTPEIKAFQSYWTKATRIPVVVDRAVGSQN